MVPHARERGHGLGGDGVEERARVAEMLGHAAPELEVQLGGVLVRHEAVHVLHGGYDLRQIHLATPGSHCLTVQSDQPNTAFAIGQVTTPTTVGVPLVTKIAAGLSGAGVYRVEAGGQTYVLKVSDADQPLAEWRRRGIPAGEVRSALGLPGPCA